MDNKTHTFDISVLSGGSDSDLFTSIINQGIDARLEGFTNSKFYHQSDKFVSRLYMHFSINELSILLRRLCERGTDIADCWAGDIAECHYEFELRE